MHNSSSPLKSVVLLLWCFIQVYETVFNPRIHKLSLKLTNVMINVPVAFGIGCTFQTETWLYTNMKTIESNWKTKKDALTSNLVSARAIICRSAFGKSVVVLLWCFIRVYETAFNLRIHKPSLKLTNVIMNVRVAFEIGSTFQTETWLYTNMKTIESNWKKQKRLSNFLPSVRAGYDMLISFRGSVVFAPSFDGKILREIRWYKTRPCWMGVWGVGEGERETETETEKKRVQESDSLVSSKTAM